LWVIGIGVFGHGASFNSFVNGVSPPPRHAVGGEVRDSADDSVKLYRPDNKARIVACVNACAGLETETLENFEDIKADAAKRADESAALLQKLLDETVEALEMFDVNPNDALKNQTVIKEARAWLDARKDG